MTLEPYKIKEVKKMQELLPHERWNVLKDAQFNTFQVRSDKVAFDLVARGMSAWSHFQKAAYMIGDEAYAGSRALWGLGWGISSVACRMIREVATFRLEVSMSMPE